MQVVFSSFLDLDQDFIYESNEIQPHKQLHIQGNFILECETIYFIHKCMVNA